MTRMIMLLTLMAVCHNMQGVTVFGYTFDMPLTSRVSALYNTVYSYVVASVQSDSQDQVDTRQNQNVLLNDQAAQRAARILGHIAPEDHSSITLAPCSSSPIQRTCRILEHIAPESSFRHSMSIHPVVTNGAYTMPLYDRQLNQDVQSLQNRPTQRLSRIMGHLTPESNAKPLPIALQPTAAHSNPEIQRAVENFAKTDPNTLFDLMNRYPEAAQAFMKPAVENFAKTEWYILEKIMDCYPEAAKSFMKPASKNFIQIDILFLRKIMKIFPHEASQVFVQPAIDNFELINPTDSRWLKNQLIMLEIMNYYPESAKAFLQPAKKNFKDVQDAILCTIIQSYHEAAKELTPFAKEYFVQRGADVLLEIMHHYPEAAKDFFQPALANWAQTDQDVLDAIMYYYPESRGIFDKPRSDFYYRG